ncbi:MAG: hypothetical protein I3274_06900 [Candidatus Moeniiplasma glomeromycotorum]|nr:hypothetical protein [Candidatus Moeniiplasma glomeromycotorum]MCE8168253.1 hypothetical protein [Candidatus Moeniiplasma glomeromycotorum]
MSIINEKSEVYQNCSKCGKSTNKNYSCIKCNKLICENELADKVSFGNKALI